MEEDKILKLTHKGNITIGESKIPCAVLEDGTRVLSETGISNAILKSRSGAARRKKSSQDVRALTPVFLVGESLKPFISKELSDGAHVIKYLDGKREISGYDATILPLVCDVWLEARDAGALKPSQMDKAQNAEILMRSLAKVGIIALVDEATGYQEEREKDELQKILAKYINAELLPWTKRFPDEFYKEMFRLKKWNYKGNPKPGIVGKITKEIVYDMLPPGVVEELQNKNPIVDSTGRRKHRHHQYLTQETGIPHLDKHLLQLVTLMKISDNWKQFEHLFRRAFNIPDQMEFDFDHEEQA